MSNDRMTIEARMTKPEILVSAGSLRSLISNRQALQTPTREFRKLLTKTGLHAGRASCAIPLRIMDLRSSAARPLQRRATVTESVWTPTSVVGRMQRACGPSGRKRKAQAQRLNEEGGSLLCLLSLGI
jgi:hypothetical protein